MPHCAESFLCSGNFGAPLFQVGTLRPAKVLVCWRVLVKFAGFAVCRYQITNFSSCSSSLLQIEAVRSSVPEACVFGDILELLPAHTRKGVDAPVVEEEPCRATADM